MKGPLGRAGFTLLEVLVATAILAVVVATVMTAFNGFFNTTEGIRTRSDLYLMANACLARVRVDLASVHINMPPRYRVPDSGDDPDIYRLVGASDTVAGRSFSRLRFASLAHVAVNQLPRQGIAQVVYYVDTDDRDQPVLKRADHLYPYPDPEPDRSDPMLCDQLMGFSITYYDDEGQTYEQWDSESEDTELATPSQVEIKLTVGTEDFHITVSERIALPLVREKMLKK